MTNSFRKALLLITLLTLSALFLSGCYRQHIEPNAGRRPATSAAKTPAPAPKPTVVEEKAEIIEETYVIDAPEENTAPTAKVEEGDLDAEPDQALIEVKTVVEDQQVEEIKAEAADAVESAPAAASAEIATPMGELYYVQVGAFSDLANANNVLADLIEQGYKGSKMARTESGLYRIQAGGFTDKASADEALSKLLADFPKGFVVKGMPEE